ncbi:MAG: NRDE family protein [Sphingopyxis sp.]|uniref:NRDE family protein n=1 Tax=Sphingopyxis sp. TaxID=1908224 RepID=UPI002ABB6055|nr:NRDE family protein [Sphingopyxis sp.]MDZ3833448.1 NRDE family protein [Sphingopyxis sp.]
MRIMCVVALAWRAHPEFPLILLGNRDEFYARAAAPLGAWDDGSGVIAGRDLQAGGTWLGLHKPSGRSVVITNVRGASPDPTKESRGALVTDLLRREGRFADPAEPDLDRFNAFNLFTADADGARLFTNRPAPRISPLAPGIHALANEPATSPCPRAALLGQLLSAAVSDGMDIAALFDALAADAPPALFLNGELYGTRASTLLTIDTEGRARIAERRYEKGGRSTGTTALELRIG